MSDIKSQVQGIEPNIKARNIKQLVGQNGNIYESLVAISKRARQVSIDLKHELHNKLEEFAVSSDAIEEIHENKEQIEISKFYERLPNPVMIATEAFLQDDIHYRFPDKTEEQKEF